MRLLLTLSLLALPCWSCACTTGEGSSQLTPPVVLDGGHTDPTDSAGLLDPPAPDIDLGDAQIPDGPALPPWDGTPRVLGVTNSEYLPTVMAMIADAEERIQFVQYQLHDDVTIDKVVGALGKAAARGVDVQVLLEGDLDFNPGRIAQLDALGCRAKIDGKSKTTHAKLVVTDGTHVLVGSHNMSYMSVLYNNETDVLIDDPAAGAFFEAYADSLWDKDWVRPSLADPGSTVVRPYVDGGFREVAVPAIEAAKKRVWVITYGMNVKSVSDTIDLLADAEKRGVDVRVLLEKSSFDEGLNGMNESARAYLAARNVPVRFDGASVITHAKVVVADDEVVIGTNNWGYGGFEDNHEAGVITDDAATVQKIASYFDGLWGAATP